MRHMSFPLPHGWRTRLHFLTRSDRHLTIACGAILLAGYLIATAIASRESNTADSTADRVRNYFEKGLRQITDGTEPTPRALARWLDDVCSHMTETAAMMEAKPPTIEGFIQSGEVLSINVERAIQQHAGSAEAKALSHDFIIARIDAKATAGRDAWKRIEVAALRKPAAPLANEFLGHLLDEAKMRMEALNAYRREGALPDAKYARECAFDLAIDQVELKTVREMLADPAYRRDASAHQLLQAASLIDDGWLQVEAAWRNVGERVRLDVVLMAIAAGLLWYAVFVRFGDREPWRWIKPVPALLAGMVSVVPTMLISHYQDRVMGLTEEGGFPRDLIYFVAGVGLREEFCKLALFALFLPWLLRRRDPLKALITGAFVGLGFALEENLGYYQRSGMDVAAGRLLTANFMHAAMTGMCSLALYEMVRTRFGKAETFVGTFTAIVLVHGIYDWAFGAGQSLPMIGDISLISMLMLVLLAYQMFHQLEQMVRPASSTISLLSIFTVGSSLVVAATLILTAIETPGLRTVNQVAGNVTGYLPIVIFYLRCIGHR
jgi:RsiW-degrading membrane proteinase PrsW (M82 family)